MGKIHEALEKAKHKGSPLVTPPDEILAEAGPRAFQDLSFDPFVPVADKDSLDPNLIAVHRPNSFESEQFKILKTQILFPEKGKTCRTIMVTSAVPGEGKSFVAANLAVSIAQDINHYVLLVDCDMRRPNIHRMFGFGEVKGLSDYLTNGTPLPSVLLKAPVGKLTLLPVGRRPANPAELLSSKKMAELLKEMKERYGDRYIIIDLPPPRLTAETNAIARLVDGIILVIRYGSTRQEMIQDLIDMVGKEKIIGVVFNRCDTRGSHYYGYKKYY
jgi:exopolysaccharide/PEP-CTERM locus tyrosine autokinase